MSPTAAAQAIVDIAVSKMSLAVPRGLRSRKVTIRATSPWSLRAARDLCT